MSPSAVLVLLIFAAATLYSAVGHAGASGYLAAMALMNVAPEVMKPAALVLNVLVATIASFRYRAIPLPPRILGPLLVASIPMSFLGGAIELADAVYKPIVGIVLLAAALRTAIRSAPAETSTSPAWPLVAISGAVIGLLSGLTGTGGSIFLSPLVVLSGWAGPRETSRIAALFVLFNSLAGLAGNLASVQFLPPEIRSWAVAAAIGAIIGTELGRRWLAPRLIEYVLAIVLALAGAKMLLDVVRG
jgi:uncharacterized membrane protein YfcA